MTLEDAVNEWLKSHNLTVISSYSFGVKLGGIDNGTTWMNLSNNMYLTYSVSGYITITGSLSKKSYKAHISDPSLFPILDRALDEEDKWIRDGHRAPE
jgi:hypothetical protein